MCFESPNFEHLSLLLCAWIGSNVILKGVLSFSCSLEYLFFDLDMWECCFCLLFFGGRCVLWCLMRLTWAVWRSHATCLMCLAVDFEDSIFLASYLILLVGILFKTLFESLMVLETNSSSFMKNQKTSLCNILADSGGYLARDASLNCIVPLINWPIALSEACQQVKSGSNFIGLWLVKMFILGPNHFLA